MLKIGHSNTLSISSVSGTQVLLDGGDRGPIRLTQKLPDPELKPGAALEAFVYPDNHGALLASLEQPEACVGQVAWLAVEAVNDVGAFLSWGLPKDLFVPFAEQTSTLQPGRKVLVRVYLDNQGRLAGSMRLDRWIEDDARAWKAGQAVTLIIGDRTELGYKAIIEHQSWGLLYSNELEQPLRKGSTLNGYIQRIRSDGRADLTLTKPGYSRDRVETVADKILARLAEHDGYLLVNDKSSPAAIEALFGCSKKLFKQALGALYKQRRVELDGRGIKLLEAG